MVWHILSSLSQVASNVLRGFSTFPWMFYVAAAVDFPSNMLYSACRGQVITPNDLLIAPNDLLITSNDLLISPNFAAGR